jgi:integrase
VEAARDACRKLLGAHASGVDVQAARQAARHEQTVEGLFGYWLDDAKSRGVKTWGEEEKRYERYLKTWAKRKLSSLKKSDVQSLFARVTNENGRYAGNKLLGLVKAMFHKAPDMGYTGDNPTVGVKKHQEEKRDRFLHADELQGFFKALFSEPNETLRDVLLVALLTGARKGNVMAARWDEIDFTTGLWRIPTTKSGRPVVVPLVPIAVALLQHRREASNGSPWVFASNRGVSGHITEVKSAWKRIVTAAKLSNCRPHDLRRSLASHMAIAGTSLPTIGAMLGHSQPSTTAIYARLSNDPVRTAAESATASIMEAGGVKLLEGALMIIDVNASDIEDKSNA